MLFTMQRGILAIVIFLLRGVSTYPLMLKQSVCDTRADKWKQSNLPQWTDDVGWMENIAFKYFASAHDQSAHEQSARDSPLMSGQVETNLQIPRLGVTFCLYSCNITFYEFVVPSIKYVKTVCTLQSPLLAVTIFH